MIRAIADTHALIWYLFEDKRFSRPAKQFMDNLIINLPRPTTNRRAFCKGNHYESLPQSHIILI